MWLLKGRKKEEEHVKEEWEDFDINDYVDHEVRSGPVGGADGVKGGKRKEVLPGMSAHPEGDDISFEELMRQYREYEKQQRGEEGVEPEDEVGEGEGEGSEDDRKRSSRGSSRHSGSRADVGLGDSDSDSGDERSGFNDNRRDILKSRHGRDAIGGQKKGTKARVGTADGDYRAELREAKTPGQGAMRESKSISFKDDDGIDDDYDDAKSSRAHSRGGTGRSSKSSRPSTRASSIADRGRLDEEPMGDALFFGRKGFLDYSRKNLNSIPMGAYTGQALNGQDVLILWAHQNKIKYMPEVAGLMTALTDLRLHDNQIEKLPQEFGNLASIKRLWLNNNNLEECPECLGNLTTLEMLSLSHNPFTELHRGIGRLLMLRDLMLDGLALTVPPREIVVRGPKKIVHYLSRIHAAHQACDMVLKGEEPDYTLPEFDMWKFSSDAPAKGINDADFWKKRWIYVDASGRIGYSGKRGQAKSIAGSMLEATYEPLKLKGVSYHACKLSFPNGKEIILGSDDNKGREKIKKLHELSQDKGCVLDLRSSGLTVLPFEILRMVRLVKLDMFGNQLTHLPKLTLSYLEELVLDYNHFTLVPRTIYEDATSLTMLSLNENPIVRLPTDLGQMPKLKELRMNVHFTLESPPTIVLAKNKQLRFLRHMNESETSSKLELVDFDLNVLPREISNRWDEHPEYHNIISLNLQNNRLLEIDQGVDNWVKLTELNMSENKLQRLPVGMGALINLKDLRLDQNELLEIPRSLKNCRYLSNFHLDYNELREWPQCLQWLTSLTELTMSHNRIDDVPATASSLVKLQILKLNGNRIRSLPIEVAQWSHLVELRMNENGLSTLPETLGMIHCLEHVGFAKNDIDSFPSEVGNWGKLKSLDLSHNKIPYLPESICNSTNVKKLFLEGNPLIQLPLAMGRMQSLKKLSFSGSKWISPPPSIMSKKSDIVIEYLHSYNLAATTGVLDVGETGMEHLHADFLVLTNLRVLNVCDNRLKDLTFVMGEADGRWTKLKEDRDIYIADELIREKRRAKQALALELGQGLNTRQLRERSERVFMQIDADGGGSLDLKELSRCFRRLQVKLSPAVIKMLIAEVSNDGDDSVDMDEWVRLVNNVYKGTKDVQGIGDLRALEELDISNNKITRLPYGLGLCSSLRILNTGGNDIQVPCEDIIRTCDVDAQITVRYLKQFYDATTSNRLDLNGFTIGVIPNEVIEMVNLTELNMSGNSLRIVVAEIDKLKQIKTFDISYNRIKMLPPTIGKLKYLETLDVQQNKLQHLPAVLCKCKNLKNLLIAGNSNLMVPKELINAGTPTIKTFLKGIYTGTNDSVIDWSEINKLGVVKLRRVPDVLFSMNWITSLNLDGNNLMNLPSEMKELKSMSKLSLRNNQLEELPNELKRCRALECLLLERNNLTTLPRFLYTNLPLRVLAASYNKLDSECIPDDLPLKAASKLQALVLDCNNIGKMSGAIGLFPVLQVLSFSGNTVESLPEELAENKYLTDLQLDGNRVASLPQIMSTMVSLTRFKMNDNKLEVLPTWIGALTRLKHLSLANNKLQYVPYDIVKLPLKVFTLDGNPLVAVETGVLAQGPQGVVDFMVYNHEYDIKDKNILPGPSEQRKQINAAVNALEHQLFRLQETRLEAESRAVGGTNLIELTFNKIIGDRTDSRGAIILDEEMLAETRLNAERTAAANSLFAFVSLLPHPIVQCTCILPTQVHEFNQIGPNLVSTVVKAKAEEVFYLVDEDGGGSLDMNELRECFKMMGVTLSDMALRALMRAAAEDPDEGIKPQEFKQLVYSIYSTKTS